MLKSALSLDEGQVGGKGEAKNNVDRLNFFLLSMNYHSFIFYHPMHNGSMQLGPVTQHHLTAMTPQHDAPWDVAITMPNCYDAATHDTMGM